MTTTGAMLSRVKLGPVALAVLPAASVSVALRLWVPCTFSSVTVVDQLPSACTVAVATSVLPSSTCTVVPASSVPTLPVRSWARWLVRPPVVAMTSAGATVSSVKAMVLLVPRLVAGSVSVAVMLCRPCTRASVTVVVQLPSACTVAVPISVAPSSTCTVEPTSSRSTLPAMTWAGLLVRPPAVVMATTGAMVSSVYSTAALVPGLPARSVSVAARLWVPCRSSRVTVVLQLPLASTVVVPISVAPSRICTVVVGLASVAVPVMSWLRWLIRPPAVPMTMAGAVMS